MPANPLSDAWAFLTANTGDYNNLGPFKYVLAALFLALIAGSIVIAGVNWARDPAQRTGRNVAVWLIRAGMAAMWFQGSIWKLPLPASGAFTYWTTQLGTFSALPFHPWLVEHVFLPGIGGLDPLVYCFESLMAVSLLLGLAVRLSGILAMLFMANIWLGLYNDPSEWAWESGAIIAAHGMFAATEAGRCLGLDNLLRGAGRARPARRSALWRAYLLAS